MGELSIDLQAALAAIRTEYERGISDAYAGGPSGRELSWRRLNERIDDYARTYAAANPASTERQESSSPILAPDSATAQQSTSDEEPSGKPAAAPRAKPTARKATAS